jgi:hypothetical protein
VTCEEFYRLVRELREQQRRWFRSKGEDRAALSESKRLEREVDRALADHFEQGTLFDR